MAGAAFSWLARAEVLGELSVTHCRHLPNTFSIKAGKPNAGTGFEFQCLESKQLPEWRLSKVVSLMGLPLDSWHREAVGQGCVLSLVPECWISQGLARDPASPAACSQGDLG